MEGAAGWGVERAGHIAGQQLDLSLPLQDWVGDGHGGKQCLSVRMKRTAVQLFLGRNLHNAAQVHDRNGVAQMFNHGQIVGDEDQGQIILLLESLEQVDHLGLDGHVQSRDRFVAHYQLRVANQTSSQGDALALASGELVRKTRHMISRKPNPMQDLRHHVPFRAPAQASHKIVDGLL